MTNYTLNQNIEIQNTNGLRRVVTTPEGRAFGNVPGREILLDPAYANASESTARNRAKPVDHRIIETFGEGSPDPIRTLNGLPWFVGDTDRRIGIRTRPRINKNEWTVFAVVMPEPREGGTNAGYLVSNLGSEAEGELHLSIGWPRSVLSALRVYEQGSLNQRISADIDFASRSIPSLVEITFSIEYGLKIFDGGDLVAENPDDKRPLTYEVAPTDSLWFANGHCRGGISGLYNIDLSKEKNAGRRASIVNFLKQKYGIS